MRRITLPREFYIRSGSVKVADKKSDAVAHLWVNKAGQPGATVFFGKQGKPVLDYRYANVANRDQAVADAFARRQASAARNVARRAERSAWVSTYKVGDIFKTCWGYDQTNVEYFELVEVKGKHGILRELKQDRVGDGYLQGSTVPLPGDYIGEPIRRLATEYGFKIDDVRRAFQVKGESIGGVRVIQPSSWSAYH